MSKLSLRSGRRKFQPRWRWRIRLWALYWVATRDAADAGVERIRQREVDDARLAAEEHRRLGPLVGELHQPAAAASGEHIGHGAACERGSGRDLGHRCETLVSLGKSAHSYLGCLSTTAIDEPRELARMDCPPGLLVGPSAPTVGSCTGGVRNRPLFPPLILRSAPLARSRKSEPMPVALPPKRYGSSSRPTGKGLPKG